jgi:RNA polymerase sigma-70 factor, ECF subfamily
MLADEELMELLAGGDARAFELIYDRHGRAAFSLAYRIVGDRTLAEDATQEAFLGIWRSRLRYEPERGSVRSWVLAVVHSRTVDALRRDAAQERRRVAAAQVAEREEAPERIDVEVVRRDEAETVRAALDGLPDHQGKVIELAYFGGFSASQIADMLETPIGTVKSRMRLGLEKLRQRLPGELAAREGVL